MDELAYDTKCVRHPDVRGPVRPLATPIIASSTFSFSSADDAAASGALSQDYDKNGWFYSRVGNPTVDVASRVITSLEGGCNTLMTASGMGAISNTVLALVKQGDHVVVADSLYVGTHMLFQNVVARMGVEVEIVSATDASAFAAARKENTVLYYAETVTNPSLKIMDLEAFGKLSGDGVVTIIDNTFPSPHNVNPIPLGVDVCIHSCTKYLSGHSDVTMGSATCRTPEVYNKIWKHSIVHGATASPFEASLLLRGIKTLSVRMDRINVSALKIAQYLEGHEKVSLISYPGLQSHPQHDLASRQINAQGGFGGVISFATTGGPAGTRTLLEAFKVIHFGVSLGGVESLAEDASSMTHNGALISEEDKAAAGIPDGLLRLSVGLEDVQDLIGDLSSALDLL